MLRWFDRRGLRKRLHRYSERHGFALELRISLIVLFALRRSRPRDARVDHAGRLRARAGGVGRRRATSAGAAAVRHHRGFFGPLFFVWLGASLQVRELGDHPRYIGLGVGLGVGAVLAHFVGRLMGQPLALAALAAAQLGVPVAAATLGTEKHLLVAGRTVGADARSAADDRGDVGGQCERRRQREQPASRTCAGRLLRVADVYDRIERHRHLPR